MSRIKENIIASSTQKKSGYLPSLDGWRCIAILAVIASHDRPEMFTSVTKTVGDLGALGVRLFFALSGLLICTRLLAEEQKDGRVRLKAFYIRRFFRIQPAALAYPFVIALLCGAGILHESRQSLLAALFSYQNFVYRVIDSTGRFSFAGHFWTLAAEEHFYILLSVCFLFFKRSRLLSFSILLLMVVVFQRYAIRFSQFSFDISTRRTYWVIQYFFVPAILALLLQLRPVRQEVQRLLHPWVAYAITFTACGIWAVHRAYGGAAWYVHGFYVGENGVLPYFFGVWLVSTMLHPASWSTRLLETSALRYIGRLSYSLYLWHILYFVPVHPWAGVTSPVLHALSERPWKYPATLATAMLSYYFIEKPFLRLGHRLAPPATPGHADLEPESSGHGERSAAGA